MIGIDTNVLVRYITQDDPEQARIATNFIEEQCSRKIPGFINHIVLCELVWVLRRSYRVDREQILTVIDQILRTVQIQVQNPQVVWRALKLARTSEADFADCLIAGINGAADCSTTITFDQRAVEINGMKLMGAK